MRSRLLFFLLIFFGTQVYAQKNIGDTLEILYWPDNGPLNRIQTRDSSGLILCKYYTQQGFLSMSGCLMDSDKPLSDRKTGVWIHTDSSGKIIRKELYRKGEQVYTTYVYEMQDAQMYDSVVKVGRHRYERYRFRNGIPYYFNSTRTCWVRNSLHHLQYDLNLRSYYSGESDDVLTVVYDTTGELISRQKYFLGNDRSITKVLDSTIVIRKSTWKGNLRKVFITDTGGVVLESSKYYRKLFTGRYNYSGLRKYKKYNKQGVLVSKSKDRRLKEVTWTYYSSGSLQQKRKSKWCGDFNKSWNEAGKRRMVTRDWRIGRLNRYTRITWSYDPRKRTVSHKRPSRFPMF